MRFFELFASTPNVVTCFSQGVNQSAQGTDKVNSIINCHLATGRIGKPGAGPFSLTGQPNAMGGREVGGLANQLAAHMGFSPEEVDRVGRFWRAPNMVASRGPQGHADVRGDRARQDQGALGHGDQSGGVAAARGARYARRLESSISLSFRTTLLRNDTINAGAHILLPAAAWGEKDGTVTNSERRISRQRTFLPAAGEAEPDWWIVSQVAHRMGYRDAFGYEHAADIFREHAALSAFENHGTRDFDIGGLAKIDDDGFNALNPVQWPAHANGALGTPRLFGDGKYFTHDRKARLVAPDKPALSAATSAQFPFRLNTGRIRDQWHTMTRSGLSPRLAQHVAEPFVEVHPADAAAFNLVDGGFARLRSSYGTCVLKVVVTESQRQGSLFAPIHWSDETASCARIGELVTAANDPYSGQPEVKATPVAIRPVAFAYRGFLLATKSPALPDDTWWARVTVTKGVGLLLASNDRPGLWRARAADLFETSRNRRVSG